jgi:hypothetical protein
MVAHSGKLVSAAEDALLAAANKARDPFSDALERLYEAYKTVSNLTFYATKSLTSFFPSDQPFDGYYVGTVQTRVRFISELSIFGSSDACRFN